MRCDGLAKDIYSDYVLGTLAGPDLGELNSHLSEGCTRCKSELASTRSLWYNFAKAIPATAAPRRVLRQRVIASVGEQGRISWWPYVAALASVIFALYAGFEIGGSKTPSLVATLPFAPPVIAPETPIAPAPAPSVAVTPKTSRASEVLAAQRLESGLLARVAEAQTQLALAQQDLSRQKQLLAVAERERDELSRKYQTALAQPKPDNSELQRQLVAAQLRTQQLQRDVAEYRTLLVRARERLAPVQTASLLSDPTLRLVRLHGTVKGTGVEGHALVASGSQVIFYASQLPSLPAGRAYQLWLIRGSAPAIVSAGVFQPNAQQAAVVQFNQASFTSGITAMAVTDEPESGSPTPTGHKLLIGS